MLRLILLIFLTRLSIAGYVIQDSYVPSNFFDMFDFFTGEDPTQGYVNFLDQPGAQGAGLLSNTSNSVKFGVDSQTVAPAGGRSSVRLQSKTSYNQGLIVLDVAHMPGGICGTWPAFWTIGPDWPTNGEIDIIEGVNSATSNAMTLHTAAGCSINAGNSRFSGAIQTDNCFVNAPGQGQNVGCSIDTKDTTTYGAGFNSGDGGVYATEWTATSISIYHFSRGSIPADLTAGTPDPSTWGQPLSVFNGCDFTTAVNNQSIIFDTTFCGQWAGQQAVWEADAVCSQKAATCQDYVANNPTDFADAYWEVNSIKVFQLDGGYIGATPVPPVASSSAPAVVASSAPAAAPSAPSATRSNPHPAAASSAPPAISTSSTPAKVPMAQSYSATQLPASSAAVPSSFLTISSLASISSPVTAASMLTSTHVVTLEETTTITAGDLPTSTLKGVAALETVSMPADDCAGNAKSGCISLGAKGRQVVDRRNLQRRRAKWVVDREGDGLAT